VVVLVGQGDFHRSLAPSRRSVHTLKIDVIIRSSAFHLDGDCCGRYPTSIYSVGRLPHYYSREVFDTYIDGMKRWVRFAREGREAAPEDGEPPVNVPANREWAESLDGRLLSLTKLVQPLFQ
jgi:hypothetical protein